MSKTRLWLFASATLVAWGAAGPAHAQAPVQAPPNLSFFVTSVGSGKGADLGGLEGADRQWKAISIA